MTTLEAANGCDSIIQTNLTVILVTSTTPSFFQKLSIYPNPSQDHINLRHEHEGQAGLSHIEVYNYLGQKIYEAKWKENVGINHHRIETKNWPSGDYLISVGNEFGKRIERVIKN